MPTVAAYLDHVLIRRIAAMIAAVFTICRCPAQAAVMPASAFVFFRHCHPPWSVKFVAGSSPGHKKIIGRVNRINNGTLTPREIVVTASGTLSQRPTFPVFGPFFTGNRFELDVSLGKQQSKFHAVMHG
jgi:hypothetical protein